MRSCSGPPPFEFPCRWFFMTMTLVVVLIATLASVLLFAPIRVTRPPMTDRQTQTETDRPSQPQNPTTASRTAGAQSSTRTAGAQSSTHLPTEPAMPEAVPVRRMPKCTVEQLMSCVEARHLPQPGSNETHIWIRCPECKQTKSWRKVDGPPAVPEPLMRLMRHYWDRDDDFMIGYGRQARSAMRMRSPAAHVLGP